MKLAAAVLAAALLAPVALARRPAPKAVARAVRRATVAYIHRPGSAAARDNRVVSVALSTVNPAYAVVRLESRSAGPSLLFLHRRAGAWRVVDFGSGGFPCSDAGARVMKDLLGGCVPG